MPITSCVVTAPGGAAHQQRERKAVECAVGGVIDVVVARPQLDQAHQRAKAPVKLRKQGERLASRSLSSVQQLCKAVGQSLASALTAPD